MMEELGLPENATREQVDDALWEKRLKDLGLTWDSTIAEYRDAVKARMLERRQEGLKSMREKLGLAEDATEEQVKEALRQWREDNREMMPGMGRGMGRGPGRF